MRMVALSFARFASEADNGHCFLAPQIMHLLKLGSATALASLSPLVTHAQDAEAAPAEAREAENAASQVNDGQTVTIEQCRALAEREDQLSCYRALRAQREAQIAELDEQAVDRAQTLTELQSTRAEVQTTNAQLEQEVEGLTQLRDITREEIDREPDHER